MNSKIYDPLPFLKGNSRDDKRNGEFLLHIQLRNEVMKKLTFSAYSRNEVLESSKKKREWGEFVCFLLLSPW